MDGSIDGGQPLGDPIQYRLQQKSYEHRETKQRGDDLGDREHDVTGGVQARMVPL